MITKLIIEIIVDIVASIFSFLPVVTVADIPIIGENVSTYLLMFIMKWNAFMITFPYAQTGWDVFIYVIIPFEALMLVSKFLLGNRTPSHQIS